MASSSSSAAVPSARHIPVVLPAGQSKHALIDIGINLTSDKFRNVDAVVARAHEAGLTHLILTGTSVRSSRDALKLCQRFSKAATSEKTPILRCTIGVHPHDAKTWNGETEAAVRDMLQGDKKQFVVAVGECGLDFNRMFSPRDQQEAAFEAQLRLAAELQLPVFLHQRDAHESFLAILTKHREALKDVPLVVHCFTGTLDEVRDYLALGDNVYVGLTGFICDERPGRGAHLNEVAAAIPVDRLLIETDGPYILPRNAPKAVQKASGNCCEPWMLVYVLQRLAQHRGISTDEGVAELAAQLHANTLRVFKLQEEQQ